MNIDETGNICALQQRSVYSLVPVNKSAEADQSKAELILIGERVKTVDKQTHDKKRQTIDKTKTNM